MKNKIKPENETPCHSSLSGGIICGPHRGSLAVRDHLRSSLGIISGLGIICGGGSCIVFCIFVVLTRNCLASTLDYIVIQMRKVNLEMGYWVTLCYCHISDIDECQLQPCSDGSCDNIPGSFQCLCPAPKLYFAGKCRGENNFLWVFLKTLTAERKSWKHETIFYDQGEDIESAPGIF